MTLGLARRGLRHADGSWRDLDLRADTAVQAASLFRPLVLGDAQESFLVILLEVARMHAIPILDHIVLGAPGSGSGRGFVSIREMRRQLFD